RIDAVSIWRGQAPEISRGNRPARKGGGLLPVRRRRDVRTGVRRAADCRPVLAARGLHPVRRNGVWLFHPALPQRVLPDPEWRQPRHHTLLFLLTADLRRPRANQRRCEDGTALRRLLFTSP